MRTRLTRMAGVFVVLAVGLQFTSPSHTNPPVDESNTLERTAAVPDAVARVLANSCNDCHSNRTNWRWYTYVAPVSWLTVSHVNHGRSELNFSVWGTYGPRMRETRLRAICHETRGGSMPLRQYVLAHPGTKPSPDEIESVCDWTESELRR